MNQQSSPIIVMQPNKYLLVVALLVIFSILSVHEPLAHNHEHTFQLEEDCQHCVISESSEDPLHYQIPQLFASDIIRVIPLKPTISGFLTYLFLSNRDPPLASYF